MSNDDGFMELTTCAALEILGGIPARLHSICPGMEVGVSSHLLGMTILLSITQSLYDLSDGELTDVELLTFQKDFLAGVNQSLGCHLKAPSEDMRLDS